MKHCVSAILTFKMFMLVVVLPPSLFFHRLMPINYLHLTKVKIFIQNSQRRVFIRAFSRNYFREKVPSWMIVSCRSSFPEVFSEICRKTPILKLHFCMFLELIFVGTPLVGCFYSWQVKDI